MYDFVWPPHAWVRVRGRRMDCPGYDLLLSNPVRDWCTYSSLADHFKETQRCRFVISWLVGGVRAWSMAACNREFTDSEEFANFSYFSKIYKMFKTKLTNVIFFENCIEYLQKTKNVWFCVDPSRVGPSARETDGPPDPKSFRFHI